MSRGDLRGGAGVVATTNATTLAGVTPTAAGLALLDDATAADQRTTLGLGTIATQNANNVAITGGSVTGITDLAVADGGTGASDASGARTNLGLAIGTNIPGLTGGYVPTSQLGSGSPSASTYLRGDGSWAAIAAAAGVGAFSSRPSAGNTGALYYPTDGPLQFVDDGSAWRPVLLGGALGTQPPAAAGWTKRGASSQTLTDSLGTLLITSHSGADECWTIASLGSTYTVTMAFTLQPNSGAGGSESLVGIALRNSADGKLYRYSAYYSTGAWTLQLQNFTVIGTPSGGAVNSETISTRMPVGGQFFIRAVQDSTNLTYYYTLNGIDWHQWYQHAKASFTTPNQGGIYSNKDAGSSAHRVISWLVA